LLVYNSFFGGQDERRAVSTSNKVETASGEEQPEDKAVVPEEKKPQEKKEIIDLELLKNLKFEELKDNPYELRDYKAGKKDLFEILEDQQPKK